MKPWYLAAILVAGACADQDIRPVTDDTVPSIPAVIETQAVASSGDAADDPAIFIHPGDPARSVILGTDKQAGLYVYSLDGAVLQFLETGRLNNVDLRQDGLRGVAVATNRSDNSVAVFSINGGQVSFETSFPAIREEPYGVCMARAEGDGAYLVTVTHKGGEVDIYSLNGNEGAHLSTLELGEQLEGCVFDEANGTLFVGREEGGIDRFDYAQDGQLSERYTVDTVGSENGIVYDIEGLTIYLDGDSGYLVASSQGNNTYAVYTRDGSDFVGRFSIRTEANIDGAEETDGIDVTSAALPGFPEGFLVVQDGFNDPDGKQNYKIVDWREVMGILDTATP